MEIIEPRAPRPSSADAAPRPKRDPSFAKDAGAPRDPKNPRDGGRRQAQEKAKEDKPRFTITCQECGTQAEVPFQPIEGRQIFCQPCYRARKGTATKATEGVAIESEDVGIVE